MESSVDFGGAFDLWKALLQKWVLQHAPHENVNFQECFSILIGALLCGFLCRCLLQIVLQNG